MTAAMLAELEGLVANRTPGEWRPQLASDSLHLTRVYNDEGSTICASIRAKDARLIVWLVNNAPAMLRSQTDEISALRSVLGQNKAAIDFYDKVQASSPDEQIAVGGDHWDFLLTAARQARTALLKPEEPR